MVYHILSGLFTDLTVVYQTLYGLSINHAVVYQTLTDHSIDLPQLLSDQNLGLGSVVLESTSQLSLDAQSCP